MVTETWWTGDNDTSEMMWSVQDVQPTHYREWALAMSRETLEMELRSIEMFHKWLDTLPPDHPAKTQQGEITRRRKKLRWQTAIVVARLLTLREG